MRSARKPAHIRELESCGITWNEYLEFVRAVNLRDIFGGYNDRLRMWVYSTLATGLPAGQCVTHTARFCPLSLAGCVKDGAEAFIARFDAMNADTLATLAVA